MRLLKNRLFFENIDFLANEDNATYTDDLLNGVNLTDDLRPDFFSFSFPGYSGNFFIDKTGQPRLMTLNSELKIEFVASETDPTLQNTIVITTPNGLKYFFGGDNATESTSAVLDRDYIYSTITDLNNVGDPIGIENPVGFEISPKAITSFYLFKIEHPFGDSILFDYLDYGDQELVLAQGDELIVFENNVLNSWTVYDQVICGDITFEDILDKYLKHTEFIGKIFNRKKLSKIHSSNSDFEIRFNSEPLLLETVGDVDTPQYDDRVLRSIEVYNNLLTENVKNIKLDYLMTPYRFFLQEVITNNDADINSTNKCSSYKLEYDNPLALPARFSKAQDMLGYFNNQLNNPNLLPQTSQLEFEGIFNDLADRSNNFEYAKKGSLTKVIYPSGGHTLFEYESPKVEAITDQELDLLVYANQINSATSNKLSAVGYLGDIQSIGNPTIRGVSQDQTIEVFFKCCNR